MEKPWLWARGTQLVTDSQREPRGERIPGGGREALWADVSQRSGEKAPRWPAGQRPPLLTGNRRLAGQGCFEAPQGGDLRLSDQPAPLRPWHELGV